MQACHQCQLANLLHCKLAEKPAEGQPFHAGIYRVQDTPSFVQQVGHACILCTTGVLTSGRPTLVSVKVVPVEVDLARDTSLK